MFSKQITNNSKRVMFIDENDFIKKYRSLRKYCPGSFKYLCFKVLKNMNFDKENRKYVELIPTDKDFKAIHGEVKLIYSIKNKSIILENILPAQFLLDGYKRELDTYKGIPYRNKKDIFKINFIKRSNQ